jgi:hypothetical protein
MILHKPERASRDGRLFFCEPKRLLWLQKPLQYTRLAAKLFLPQRRHTPGRPPASEQKMLKAFSRFSCLVAVVLLCKETKKGWLCPNLSRKIIFIPPIPYTPYPIPHPQKTPRVFFQTSRLFSAFLFGNYSFPNQ